MSEDRLELGRRIQAEFDPDIGAQPREQLEDLAPAFADITVAVAFGDLASRPGLSGDRRAMAVVSALTTLGQDRQLRVWLRFALNSGVTPDEIVETIMQLAVHAGRPRALDALRAAKDVFAQQGAAVRSAAST